MGLLNWFVQRSMKKEAKRLAQLSLSLLNENKDENSSLTDVEIIKNCVFSPEAMSKAPVQSKNKVDKCCQTVNGVCYLLALDAGKFKGWMNFRSLQFTAHMDRELLTIGFPKQSIEQKTQILEAMKLNIDGWEEITGDVKA